MSDGAVSGGEKPSEPEPIQTLLTDAEYVSVWAQLSSNVAQLWAIFTAANFAAAAFSISADDISFSTNVVMTLAYWTFALGLLALLYQHANIMRRLSDLHCELKEREVIQVFIRRHDPVRLTLVVHLVSGWFVTAIIWRIQLADWLSVWLQ